jgi:hypothetical protein
VRNIQREKSFKVSQNYQARSILEGSGSSQTIRSGERCTKVGREAFQHFVVQSVLECCKSGITKSKRDPDHWLRGGYVAAD